MVFKLGVYYSWKYVLREEFLVHHILNDVTLVIAFGTIIILTFAVTFLFSARRDGSEDIAYGVMIFITAYRRIG